MLDSVDDFLLFGLKIDVFFFLVPVVDFLLSLFESAEEVFGIDEFAISMVLVQALAFGGSTDEGVLIALLGAAQESAFVFVVTDQERSEASVFLHLGLIRLVVK